MSDENIEPDPYEDFDLHTACRVDAARWAYRAGLWAGDAERLAVLLRDAEDNLNDALALGPPQSQWVPWLRDVAAALSDHDGFKEER
jgi:hypothetical protein